MIRKIAPTSILKKSLPHPLQRRRNTRVHFKPDRQGTEKASAIADRLLRYLENRQRYPIVYALLKSCSLANRGDREGLRFFLIDHLSKPGPLKGALPADKKVTESEEKFASLSALFHSLFVTGFFPFEDPLTGEIDISNLTQEDIEKLLELIKKLLAVWGEICNTFPQKTHNNRLLFADSLREIFEKRSLLHLELVKRGEQS